MSEPRYFPISRWNLTGGIVRRSMSWTSPEAAEQAGREAEATYQDQKFERVFRGTWEEYDQLIARGR